MAMTCPECQQPLCGVQYALTPEDYDGVSEWCCEACGLRIGRWSGEVLAEGQLEPRYGLRKHPHGTLDISMIPA